MLKIDGLSDRATEEFALRFKAFATEEPAETETSGHGIAFKGSTLLNYAAKIDIVVLLAFGIAPTTLILLARLFSERQWSE